MAGRDFSAELFGPSAGRDFSAELFGAPPPPEKQSAFRQIADVPLGIAKGAVQGVRMIADAFGAGSDTSKAIKSAENYLADLMSAQAKNDQQEISRIMKDAEDKGVLDQVKAGVRAFTVAPVDTLSSALGTAAPVIVGALGAKILGAGALATTGVSALTGAGMGAGVVKGSIYEETKRALKEAGASEQDAEARAKLAQEYGGKNLDQILLGTVLGGAAAVGPLEKGAAGILARRILGKTEGTEAVAGQAVKGAARRRLEAGALEAVPEMVQAGQEQVAQNIALQREGFDVPTFRGAVSAATLEGLAGAGLGAAFGGGKPEVAPTPEAPAAPEAPVAPEVGFEQLTPQQKQELERQRAGAERPKTTEELLAGIQTGRPTTLEDIARIKDEHETAVIEGLLAQDAEMKRANDWIAAEMERVNQLDELRNQARDEEERQAIERKILTTGIQDVDRRVRESRIFARVQDLIDRNIPYASTAINDINQKFGVINEAPLNEEERARIENIMGMVNTFTNFVNLPVLAPKPVDQFAENQAMEALIKERTERGQAQPLRTAPIAPSPSVQETPVSQGVGKGAALRPEGRVEPSVTENRELVTPTVETPAPPVEAAAPVVESAAPPALESDQKALEEKRQMIADMIETKKANREPVPEAWIKRLADLSAQLRGETISEGETYSMEVAGHPLFDGPPVLRNLIPIKVKDSDAAQRALDRALDLEKQFATEFYGARQALSIAKTASQKKAAQARIKKLNDQGWDEDALQTLRNETIQELSRLVDVTQKAASKAEAPPQELKSLGKAEAKQNFQQALRPLLNKFGLKDVQLKIEEGMDDDGSYSQQLIRLAAQQANPVRTLRHESVHALRELGFFTDAQWKSLSNMAKEKWVDQYLKQRNVQGRPLKAGEESRYDAYMREYNGDMEKITEEAVADAFADFDATKPPAGLIQALLKRMKDLFQSIKSALTKVESPEQIFGKVEKGELKPGEKRQAGERKSVRDRATANFLRWFGDSKVVDEKGEPLVVYHGTRADFSEFSRAFAGEGMSGEARDGFFFTSDPVEASAYAGGRAPGGRVMPVYVSLKRPAVFEFSDHQITDIIEADSQVAAMLRKSQSFLSRLKGTDGLMLKDIGGVKGKHLVVAFKPTQIKSAIGNNGDYSLTNPDIRKSLGKATDPGQQALELVNSMNMGIPQSEPGFFKRLTNILRGEGQMPDLNLKKAKEVAIKWSDQFEKNLFSADAPFQNALRRGVKKDLEQNAETVGLLVQTSISQTVGIDNVVNKSIIDGGADYSEDMKKWHSVAKKDNMKVMAEKLQEIAQKYNKTSDEMKSIAHAYLVSKRLPGILKNNEELTENIKAEKATAKPDRKKIEEWEAQLVYVSDKQIAQMDKGLSLVNLIPELTQVSDILNGIRENFIDVAVKSGLWTREYAEAMLNNVDYVPYYRVEQLEENAGPLEFLRGLQVKAKEHKLKGSDSPVNDVFDNMVRWSSFLLNRSMRAHKAKQMIYAAKDIELGGRKMAVKVTEPEKGMNIVRVFNNGVQELWDVADPNFVDAFAATQNVSIPMFKAAAWVAEKLRNMIVLYPMFSVAQVPQDSVAAVFTSGLKPQFALKIPYLAVKEFVKTIAKTSATHNELAKFGVVGARDFSADVMRKDAEIEAGLKSQKGPWEKTKEILEHIAMAGDNAVRQATYIAARQQGVSEMEALEKSFEIFNVRRRGTSKALNLAGQTIPFFYAYLAAQRVAYKTITGVGTSPTTRRAALETLAYTTAAVMTLSMLYAMMVADDEDYAETPAAVRDRTITIPGTGGVRIPLRPDFFLFPKIVAEHTYLMLTDRGYEDGAKFRTSMKDALFNAVTSPTVIPQIVKPALEVGINYSFFEGRPVVGQFEKEKALERQFNDSTSELSKLLGQTGLVSPIAADHLIRGMLGSVGGLILFGSNFFSSDPDVPRPELSWGEVAAALPGTSGFLKRPQESALKNDFFLLRDEVEKAVNTFNDIKTRSPQGMQDFLDDEKQMARYMLGKPVDQINRQLSKIRRQMTVITNMPESQMSAEDKADNIRQLRELEREYLKSVDVKALREMAKI